ncbi:MAG: hypothetical protein HY914_10980 [Desulfomonile tiedjei]|nr:hypothetical protein [Desulfomonile tiedjei]
MSRAAEILYVAAGAGMGHLVRASAVCMALRDEGVRGRIVTHSRYAEVLRGITGLTIEVIPSNRWRQDVLPFARELNPRLVVLDTFPWGLRGEWLGLERMCLRFAIIARRLNIPSYFQAAGLMCDLSAQHFTNTDLRSSSLSQAPRSGCHCWLAQQCFRKDPARQASSGTHVSSRDSATGTVPTERIGSRRVTGKMPAPLNSQEQGPQQRHRTYDMKQLTLQGTKVIAAEPLNDDYACLLQASGAEVHALHGRIRFPSEAFPAPVPAALEQLLDSGPLWLVVHSGPDKEVRELVDRARAEITALGSGAVAAVVPRPVNGLSCPVFNYFPAARLYDRAYRVLTGAGYNSVAEIARWKNKHTCIPFPRRYDIQEGRIRETPEQCGDGTAEAARLLASWLS